MNLDTAVEGKYGGTLVAESNFVVRPETWSVLHPLSIYKQLTYTFPDTVLEERSVTVQYRTDIIVRKDFIVLRKEPSSRDSIVPTSLVRRPL